MAIVKMLKGYEGSDYKQGYRQLKFTNVYGDEQTFLQDYNNIGIPPTLKSEESVKTLFYLLYARYGNDRIASDDMTRFKYQLFSLIFQFGPTWEKRLSIQDELRSLTPEQLVEGSRQMYNSAVNPSTEPGTNTTDELTYISGQNVTHNRKGKLEAYGLLMSLLETDVTGDFIRKFNSLFIKVVEPDEDGPVYYD